MEKIKFSEMKTLSIILIVLLPILLRAQAITVKQDGTGDFTTIQTAVDSAQNGDTVLVWPGIYFENIEINYKNIVLGSLTLTTGNTSYTNQTIINGNKIGRCIKIGSFTDSITINGFTIINGKEDNDQGGGILIEGTYANIINCLIKHNKTSYAGGGICFLRSDGFLSNVTIAHNQSYDEAGGIYIAIGNLVFDSVNRCSIYENYAAVGSDIYTVFTDTLHIYVDTFTVQNPDYYYVFSKDTAQSPQNKVYMHILHHSIEQTNDDLFVSSTGDNNNDGHTFNTPLKTISYALLKAASDSVTPDTIHIANGIYSDSLTGEHFPLSIKRDINIIGNNKDSVILDAENKIYLLRGVYGADNYLLKNMILKNGNGEINSPFHKGGSMFFYNRQSIIENLKITNCIGDVTNVEIKNSNGFVCKNVLFEDNIGGKSLRIVHSDKDIYFDTTFIDNCKFEYNKPNYIIGGGFGGGSDVIQGDYTFPGLITAVFNNCIFDNNHSKSEPSTAYYGSTALGVAQGSFCFLINCTFTDNTSTNPHGGNIGVTSNGQTYVYNSIFYNDEPIEFYMGTYYNEGYVRLDIFHSLVDGGEAGIDIINNNCLLNYDTTNLDTDPLFYGGAEFPYNLSDESPCIDAGTLDLPQFILDHMPETDLAGNPRIFNGKIDMGAYEWNPTVSTKEIPNAKQQIPSLTAAPNPFTTQTVVSAKWDNPAHINIEIYNNAGLLIKTLQSGSQPAGSCKIFWNGTDDTGNNLPAGIYYVILRINNKEMESLKIIKQ